MKKTLKYLAERSTQIKRVAAMALVALIALYGLWVTRPKTTVDDKISSTSTEAQIVESTYEIKDGDSLWKIAQEVYGSGYEWEKILKANEQIKNPNLIEKGMKISIPTKNQIQDSELESEDVDSNDTYTVISGDNLWKIAQKECGTGHAWLNIARANNLVRPSQIHRGNVLLISCK